MQTRYYNPHRGRFLNADGYVNPNGDLIGYNMFAYCSNNPVMLFDPTGCWFYSCLNDDYGYYILNQTHTIGGCSKCSQCIQPENPGFGFNLIKYIIEDIDSFDWNNEDPSVVIKSHLFSAYKGKLVIRSVFKRSGSFGVLFISYKVNTRSYPEDEVRHEYGHTIQLEQLGPIKYLMCIGLPSAGKWGNKLYYNKEWEVTADIYGGVQSRSASRQDTVDAFNYLWLSEQIGPFVWKNINW